MIEHQLISLFDTSIASYNIGNQIIMDAVRLELKDLFPSSFFINLPVDDIKTNARKYNALSSISFVGGTNILNSDIRRYRQWDLCLHNIYRLSNIVLMGCGWFQYENKPVTAYTRWAFKRIFSPRYLHSVRDNYTKQKLASIGIESINTGCPTLWRLTPEVLNRISVQKGNEVVIALTDYNRKEERDRQLLELCFNKYDKVYLFPQGTGDLDYVRTLGYIDRLTILNPDLNAFNGLLETGKVDYIGTRLHAGIRALQKSARSFIIGIDNRALEMSRDFKLPVVPEKELSALEGLIDKDYKLELSIPLSEINRWKEQFKR